MRENNELGNPISDTWSIRECLQGISLELGREGCRREARVFQSKSLKGDV